MVDGGGSLHPAALVRGAGVLLERWGRRHGDAHAGPVGSCPAYPTIYFFCAHGGAIACSLYLIWSRQVRPRPHSPWFAFGALAAFAAFTGLFNVVYHTNYMYLCEKPDAASILDYFGPWPWYLLPSAGLGILLFLALGWRFRRPR
ncbi:MAG: YwaF family protein [Bryobacterales bacterium]|nr:YwaF family protein [Bryobacterales bacterium]